MNQVSPPQENNRYMIGLLSLMTLLLYADQNLLAPNLTAIARDLGVDPAQKDVLLGGNISLAFFVLGGLVSLVAGRMADKLHRRNLLVFLIFLGEFPCATVAFVTEYHELFILRMLTGISIGGAAPLTYSLLADLVPARQRPAIAGIITMALGIGIVLGQMLAGLIGPIYGWRVPFVLVTIPNLIIAVLFLLTTREPKRGQFDHPQNLGSQDARSLKVFRNLLTIPTNRVLLVQGIFGTLPWAMIFVFLNDYLAQDCGMGVKTATLLLGVLGLSSLLGIGLGGMAGTKLYSHAPRSMPWACLIPTFLAPFPLMLLLNPSIESMWFKVVCALFTGLLGSFAVPNLRAILLEINLASNRGSMTALMTLADDLGKGLGTSLISGVAIWLGRENCFYFCALSWFGCAIAISFMIKSFTRDLPTSMHPLAQGEPA